MDNDPISLIKAALPEVTALLADAYSRAESLVPNHALSQEGLRNGHEIVLDYIEHNETGIAFEHLVYMLSEPPLIISNRCFQLIDAAGRALGVHPEVWRNVQHKT
jgi:hypothetical protein